MIGVVSPFLQEIPKCKTSMRKLRKKIYKYTSNQPKPKKFRDCTQDIFNILEVRSIPNFVMESLKKKRTLDLGSLKNVLITPGAEFPEMSSMVRNQEQEIKRLFEEHKQRMKAVKKPMPKLQHRFTACSSTEESEEDNMVRLQGYSEEEFSEEPAGEQSQQYNQINYFSRGFQGFDQISREEPLMGHQHNDLNLGSLQLRHGQVEYMALQSSLYSHEELFRF